MRDLFDDFMEELRKRELLARGQDPGSDEGRQPDDPDDEDVIDDEAVDPDEIVDPDEAAADEAAVDPDADVEDATDGPISIDTGRQRAGPPPRRRGPGGPDDGGPGRAARAGRRIGLAAAVLVVVAIFLLLSVGLDLWTDAEWYKSVSFDSVFWTRLIATFGLGVGAFFLALVVLLGNIWLAGRLAPVDDGSGGGLRSIVARLNDAARAADEGRGGSRSAFGGGRPPFGAAGGGRDGQSVVFEMGDLPDLTPLAGWALGGVAIFIALLIGGRCPGRGRPCCCGSIACRSRRRRR